MKKPEQKQLTQKYLDAMAGNTFIVPSSWGRVQQLTAVEYSFRTYANDARDYMVIERYTAGEANFKIIASRRSGMWLISPEMPDIFTAPSSSKVIAETLELLENIYNEMFSLNTSKTPIKERRAKIAENKRKMSELENENKSLLREIADFNKLNKGSQTKNNNY